MCRRRDVSSTGDTPGALQLKDSTVETNQVPPCIMNWGRVVFLDQALPFRLWLCVWPLLLVLFHLQQPSGGGSSGTSGGGSTTSASGSTPPRGKAQQPAAPKVRKSVSSRIHEAVKAIALCHNVTPVYESRAGANGDAEAAEADQDYSDDNRTYQASSPDEVRGCGNINTHTGRPNTYNTNVKELRK